MRAVAPRSDRSGDCPRAAGRTSLALALCALVALAGCSAGAESTPVAASGSTVELPEGSVAEAGYDHTGTTEKRINATLRAELEGDISVTEVVDVRATVPVARYRRSTSDGPAVVAVASSPSVQLVENPPITRDPLSTLSPTALARFVQSTYPLDVVSDAAESEVTVGGESVRLLTYDARLNRSASGTAASTPPLPDDAPLTVRVVCVDRSDDVLTVVSVTPRGHDGELAGLLAAIPGDR